MLPNHPYIKQENRNAANSRAVQIRKSAYQHGVKVKSHLTLAIRDHEQAPSESTRSALLVACGKALGYVEMRESIAPTVASDGLTKELRGTATMHLKALENNQD